LILLHHFLFLLATPHSQTTNTKHGKVKKKEKKLTSLGNEPGRARKAAPAPAQQPCALQRERITEYK
jgi:hypothetical protein